MRAKVRLRTPLSPPSLASMAALVLAGVLIAAIRPPAAGADPVVPGFDVTVYAPVIDPVRMAFDPSGVLYVGRDNTGSGGSSGDPVPIHRIGIGGSPVTEYGAAIFDPDAVVVDVAGTISGVPGSVLVGSANMVTAIRPDQSEAVPFTGSSIGNIDDMIFDGPGRLLFSALELQNVQLSTGGFPGQLYGLPSAPDILDLDLSHRIFSSAADGVIRIHDAEGVLIDPDFASGFEPYPLIAIGPGGAFGHDLYVIGTSGGSLVRIDSSGAQSVVGTGFSGGMYDMSFGPDGSLYLADFGGDRILRIAPASTGVPVNGSLPKVAVWPNPFTTHATLSFDLRADGPAELHIFDVAGRSRATLASGWLSAGRHEVAWDGRDDSGAELPAGVYFARAGDKVAGSRIVKIR